MRTRNRALLLLSMLVWMVGGCSKDGGFFPGMINHDEGPVDYRVVPITEGAGPLAKATGSLEPDETRYVRLSTERQKPYARLADAPPLNGYTMASGDGQSVPTVRITLKQAFLRDFPELDRVGEIAVVVNVKETDVGLTTNEIKSGRVVYYTEGARKRAFLNFRDQTVYGPITYKGGDLQIRVSMLELDNGDNQVAKSMLKVLADLGSTVYAPAAPVLAALEKVGSALINLNGDDLEWDYAMRLSRRADYQGAGKVFDAWIQDGYYVMIRSDPSVERASEFSHPHDRGFFSQPPNWGRLALDQRSGVLFNVDDAGAVTGEYVENSYFVFALQSGFDPTALEVQDNIATLDKLAETLSVRGDAFNKASDSIQATLKSLIDARKNKAKAELSTERKK